LVCYQWHATIYPSEFLSLHIFLVNNTWMVSILALYSGCAWRPGILRSFMVLFSLSRNLTMGYSHFFPHTLQVILPFKAV
jgi:hypothetical protein